MNEQIQKILIVDLFMLVIVIVYWYIKIGSIMQLKARGLIK